MSSKISAREACQTIYSNRSEFDNANDYCGIGGKSDGEIHKGDLEAVANDPKTYGEKAAKVARALLDDPMLMRKLDAADGKTDNIINMSGIGKLMDDFAAADEAKAAAANKPKTPDKPNKPDSSKGYVPGNTTPPKTGEIDGKYQTEKPKDPVLGRRFSSHNNYPNGKVGMDSMKQDFLNAGQKAGELWKTYGDIKVGDSYDGVVVTKDNMKDIKQKIMMDIQEQKQIQSQLSQFITNMMKQQHESTMAIIRNIR